MKHEIREIKIPRKFPTTCMVTNLSANLELDDEANEEKQQVGDEERRKGEKGGREGRKGERKGREKNHKSTFKTKRKKWTRNHYHTPHPITKSVTITTKTQCQIAQRLLYLIISYY